MLCFRKFLVAKKFMDKRGDYHDFQSKIYCLTLPKNFVEEPFCAVFQKISVAKKFMDKKEGSIKIFRRKFSVSQCRKIPYGNPSVLCFRKVAVAKKFMDKRGWEYQDFPSKIFCLTVPKISVRESFSVSLISGFENC